MEQFYSEKDGGFRYPCRCDAHNMKEYVYCEMCRMKSQYQDLSSNIDKRIGFMIAQVTICINDLQDLTDNLKERIKVLEEKLNDQSSTML
jgi:hypothetical protein